MAEGGDDQRRMLQHLFTLGVQGISSSVARPAVEANNVELRPVLVFMVKQS